MEGTVETGHIYICIDLKTFYASVECAARGLDPFTTNLVVADPERTEKIIAFVKDLEKQPDMSVLMELVNDEAK